jgi:hypothetical protein
MTIYLQVFPDGTLMDWGRHTVINGQRCGYGAAVHYSGEAAEVMRLVLKYSKKAK